MGTILATLLCLLFNYLSVEAMPLLDTQGCTKSLENASEAELQVAYQMDKLIHALRWGLLTKLVTPQELAQSYLAGLRGNRGREFTAFIAYRMMDRIGSRQLSVGTLSRDPLDIGREISTDLNNVATAATRLQFSKMNKQLAAQGPRAVLLMVLEALNLAPNATNAVIAQAIGQVAKKVSPKKEKAFFEGEAKLKDRDLREYARTGNLGVDLVEKLEDFERRSAEPGTYSDDEAEVFSKISDDLLKVSQMLEGVVGRPLEECPLNEKIKLGDFDFIRTEYLGRGLIAIKRARDRFYWAISIKDRPRLQAATGFINLSPFYHRGTNGNLRDLTEALEATKHLFPSP